MTRQTRLDPIRMLLPAMLSAATLLSCARGTPPGAPLPETTGNIPADTGALRILPLPLPPRIVQPESEEGAEPGLSFRLSEAPSEITPPDPDPAGPSAATPLSVDRTARLLSRLPPLPALDTAPFRFPAASPPLPRTGRIVLTPFPPPDTAPPPPPVRVQAPLRVVRIVPTGDTELAPHLTITFSEAMVPLTTVAGTDARTPPVRLTPQLAGRWSWIDTRTLRFQPEDRFPMATTFVVEVPAGTRPVTGPALEQTVRTEFSTPAPRAIGAYPALHPDAVDARDRRRPGQWYPGTEDDAQSVRLEPIVLIAFDQRIDPAAVVRVARIEANGRQQALRLATRDEIAADSIVPRLVEDLEDGTWVALRPVAAPPGDADVRVVLNRAVPSAEGPLTTTTAQELRFRTYGPLRIVSHGCGRDICRPRQAWSIALSNPLDEDAWSPEQVRVRPALEDMTVRMYGAVVRISGDARPHRRYVVTFAESVQDRFGQRIEEPRSVTLDVGAGVPVVGIQGAPFIVLDPEGPARVAFRSQGHRSLRVRVHRVTPEQWSDWSAALESWQRTREMAPPGELVTSRIVDIADPADFVETHIDVGPALRNGPGHAIVIVESTDAPGPADESDALRGLRPPQRLAHAWVQSTRIGLTASADAEHLYIWASSLGSGAPLGGADIRLLPTNRRTTTGPDGTARLPLAMPGDAELIATLGDDAALLPAYPNAIGYGQRGWQSRPTGELRWYTMTDRGLYQPGETVHFKGWLRQVGGNSSGALALVDVDSIRFTMRGPRREELGTATLLPGELGGFSTTVELPEAMNLGHAFIELAADAPEVASNERGHHFVQVQEFRRPEYEVRVEADPGPHIVGDVIDVTLNAEYYGGGALARAPLDWQVTTQRGHYRPPGWDLWHFGRAAWWPWDAEVQNNTGTLSSTTDAAGAHRVLIDLLSVDPPFATTLRAEAQVHDVTRQIGSAGVDLVVHPAALNVGLRIERSWLNKGQTAELELIVVDHDGRPSVGRVVDVNVDRIRDWSRSGLAAVDSGRAVCRVESGVEPVTCSFTADSSGMHRISADVRDDEGRVSRSEVAFRVAGAARVPDPRVEPGTFELVPDRMEYQPGDTARILVQPPFHPAEAQVSVRSAGVMSTERVRIETPSYELKLRITEAHIPHIRVRVEVVDAENGVHFASGEVGLGVPPHRRALDVCVTPASRVAAPGEEVTIDVEVRDADGRVAAGAEVALWMVDEAVLALGDYALRDPLDAFYAPRHGYMQDLHSRRWVVQWPKSAGPGTLSGLVLEGDVGRVLGGATVRLVGTNIETQTAYDGSFTLRGIAPGEYVLEITAADGRTGRTPVSVPTEGVHVGNLVLGESGLSTARQLALADADAASRMAAVVAVAPPPPPPGMAGPLELQALVVTRAGGAQQQVQLRTDFAPLAFFEPSLRTDARGRVQVTPRLPQSLTRYRIMAVAVSGAQRFGTGEAVLTARKELMVRIAAPRFLNYGDRFELPVLVQNVTSRAMNVEVGTRAAGIDITGVAGRRLTLAPGARAEVRFDAAAPLPGSAHVQVIAAVESADGNAASDAAGATIPVYTPATVEAFATYGTIDSAAPVVLPLARPEGVIEAFGGLEVSITSTALHSLTDAVIYLCRYPFNGTEHIASRVIAIAALRDVLAAFGAGGLPAPDSMLSLAQYDIAELVARQAADGGWPFWPGIARSHPFVSSHAAHALQRAQEKGFAVPAEALQRATEYLRNMETHVARWPLDARQSAVAYALYVRHRIGDAAAVQEARRLAATTPDRVGGELPVEAAGWLLHVLTGDPASRAEADELQRTLLNRLVETAGTVTFAERYEDGEHLLLHSRRRTDAVVLEALIAANADADISTRLAQSLLAHRVAGRWSGTQENSWVLLALDRYFRTYEATTPAFESRVWLDERFAGTHAFEGRTTERQHIDIPMPQLLRSDPDELVIAREGAGRMYYRAGVRYAPADLRTPATDRGFEVSRVYEAVDDTADVRRAEDGTWLVRAGARARVRVSMVAPSVRHHAALVDPLPAGFEPLNPELSGTGFMDDPGAAAADARGRPYDFWRRAWFEHQNLRDDRAEAFASLLPAGVYDYTYLVRATTPGTFVVPPSRAEMMYQPEVFGRGTGDVVVVR